MESRFALASMFWITTTTCCAEPLTIRLYDYTGLSAEETIRASRVTEVALAHAKIQVRWMYCRGTLALPEPSPCPVELTDGAIVLRLVSPKASAGTSSQAELGHAFVGAHGGQLASVFVPSARALAAVWGTAFDLVLGYAMAHEAVHCLIGPEHTPAGLMRSRWDDDDAREMAQLRLGLSRQEIRRAAARLQALQSRSRIGMVQRVDRERFDSATSP